MLCNILKHGKIQYRSCTLKESVQRDTTKLKAHSQKPTMQCVETQKAYSRSIYSIKSEEPFHNTVSDLIVRNATCISVCIWIMLKHVITSPWRLGIHPVLVFKLILRMPSAWHFSEEAGTPSRYRCWKPPHGAEQAQSKKNIPAAHTCFRLCTVPVSAHPPQGVLLPVYWQTGGLRWLITAETH